MKMFCALALGFASLLCAQQKDIQYTADGQFVLPKDYREWVFLSSGYATAYDAPSGSNSNTVFHNVFVNADAHRAFLKTGKWPDKTVLLLELRKSEANVSIDKQGRVQAGIDAIEVHVKDAAKGGWAFYGFHNGEEQAKPFPATASCFTCHQQHGATDTTFVQFYPTLIETAKAHGNYR